jgi:transposase
MDAATNESVELTLFSSLLDLDEFEVVHVSQDRARRVRTLTIVPKAVVAMCPHCHGITDERHLCRDRAVLDLPLGRWRTELSVRLSQFHCRACDRFFTPAFAALAQGAHATERLLERLERLVAQSDLSSAARFLDIPEKTAEGWYYQHCQRKAQRAPGGVMQPIRSLGIDELSLKKDTGNTAAC